MTPRRRRLDRDPRRAASTPTSWMALLAATTLGWDGRTLRAMVRADETLALDDSATYALVVQSYDGSSIEEGARPVGSLQRFVSGAELRRGVDVNLIELRSPARVHEAIEAVVVAWITAENASLEMDGRAARPELGQGYGRARARALGPARPVRIALSRTIAA
jgi:hypothetical protein